MAKELFRWSDGACSVVVERLALNELGIRTEGDGVILTDEAAKALAVILRAG